MDKREKWKDYLEKRREKLQNFLKFGETIYNITPYVEKSLKITNWEIDTANGLPSYYSNNIPNELLELSDLQNSYIETHFGGLPSLSIPDGSTTVSMSAMASSKAYEFLDTIKFDPKPAPWVNEQIRKYDIIQDEFDKISIIKNYLKRLDLNLVNVFQEIDEEMRKLKAGMAKMDAIAIKMRTLSEKVKGEINARRPSKRSVKDIWKAIAEEIVNKDAKQPERKFFNELCEDNLKLHKEFSGLCKLRKTATVIEFEDLFRRFVDNIFSILNMIVERIPQNNT